MNKKRKNNKVLVTGAAGFVGSHLCEGLLNRGFDVIGLIYGNDTNIGHLKKNKKFKTVKGDITNFQEVLDILKKYEPDGVFHVAAAVPSNETKEDSPSLFFEVNVKGTFNLLEACRQTNIEKFIYSSSMSVYNKEAKQLPVSEENSVDPRDFYGLSKWQGEELVRIYTEKYKSNAIILRYAGIYGPRKEEGAVATFIKNALQNKPIDIFSDISWDIVYVEDVVQANILAFEKLEKLGFAVVNIGSGREVHIKELAGKIIGITKSHSKIKINKIRDSFRFYFKINKAQKLLGFKPISLEKGLFLTVQWFKKQI